jgi:hypothetical protein
MAYVTVYTSSSILLLNSVRDLLAEDGIPVLADGNLNVSNMILPQLASSGSIQVNPEDAERALELIAGFEGTLGELAELDAPEE